MSQTVKDEAAKVGAFERNAGNFLKYDNPEDLGREVTTILSSKDSATRMGRLMDDIGGDPAALEGARRSAAEGMVNKFSNIAIGDMDVRNLSPKMSPFIKQRETTLRRLYGDENYGTLTKIADDIDRGVQHATRKSAATGSDTASKLGPMLDDLVKGNMDANTWNIMFLPTVGHALFSGNWASILGAAALVGDRVVGGAMRTQMQKRVQRVLVEAMADPAKGKALLERAITNEGKPNVAALAPFLATLRAEQPDDDRRARASGGRLTSVIDHVAEAARYVRLASRIKNAHGEKTKEFLNVPDATVAKALAVAHEAI